MRCLICLEVITIIDGNDEYKYHTDTCIFRHTSMTKTYREYGIPFFTRKEYDKGNTLAFLIPGEYFNLPTSLKSLFVAIQDFTYPDICSTLYIWYTSPFLRSRNCRRVV